MGSIVVYVRDFKLKVLRNVLVVVALILKIGILLVLLLHVVLRKRAWKSVVNAVILLALSLIR